MGWGGGGGALQERGGGGVFEGGLYPNAHYVDFNFFLTSCLVIFTVFCFSDGIFSSALSIHSASRLCSTFLLHIPFKNVASSAFDGFVLYLPSRFLKKSSLVGLEIPVVLKLFYSVVISVDFSGFFTYSLFQFFHYQCNSFLLSPYFWSSKSFSLFLSFFHLPVNHASILLRCFLNLLISLRILL